MQLLFAGLWGLADKKGRLKHEPRWIKSEVFPYYDVDVNGGLTVLYRLGHVRFYRVQGERFLEVLNFKRHQSPHKTERDSIIPDPTTESLIDTEAWIANGELPVNIALDNGGSRSDSLIPDSLIEDSVVTRAGALGEPLPSSKKTKKSKRKIADFDWSAHPWLDPEAVERLQSYRVEQGHKRLGPIGLTALSAKLKPYSAEVAAAMLEQTMANGWQGVYEIKAGSGVGPPAAPRKTSEQMADELRARGIDPNSAEAWGD